MGCGSSKSENIPDDVNIHSQPSTANGDTSHFQPVTCEKNSEKPSVDVPQGTKENGIGAKSVEQRHGFDGTKTTTKASQMTILHFNDVYNIEPRDREPVGGAARFATKVASFKHLNPLIAFSGDCLNPSTSEYARNLASPFNNFKQGSSSQVMAQQTLLACMFCLPHFRSCDDTLENCFFQVSSYSRAYLRTIYKR